MEDIILLNDDSTQAVHAAEYAYNLACLYGKSIIVANLKRAAGHFASPVSLTHLHDQIYTTETDDITDHLYNLKACPGVQPHITVAEAAGLAEQDIAKFINSQKTWMVVHSAAFGDHGSIPLINLQSVLNRVQCPFLMVPANSAIRPPERIAYLADLRYAQLPVLNFLKRMNTGRESVILAHICAQGLPDLDKEYAVDLFNTGLSRNVQNSQLFFSHLRVKDFASCVDQVVNGMQADMLVCVNHHFHFERLMGGNVGSAMPADINIPILVFPQ